MKFTAAVITAIIGFAAAQDISIIPECAQDCITDAISSATSCGATDYACVCENQNALIGAATPCVIEKCGAEKATGEVLPATQKFCDEVAAGGGSGGDTTSAEPTASATESATESASESATESAPGTGYQTMTTAAPTTTAGGYPTGGMNSTAVQPTSSAAVTAGAAAVGSMGGFAMLFLGAAAAL